MEKTFEQCLQEYGTGDLALPKHIAEAKKAASTWLKQKRKMKPTDNAKDHAFERGRISMINELLKEMQVQEG